MGKISSATITERLGGPPEAWTFFGQCFHAGENIELKCAILQQPSQYFFTLKQANGGPGRAYISFEAIPLFKHCNSELYRRLNVGVAFLEMQADGFDLQREWQNERRGNNFEQFKAPSGMYTPSRNPRRVTFIDFRRGERRGEGR